MNTYELLKTLTETPGPSGLENKIAAAIQTAWQPLVDSLSVDRVGSLVGVKRGRPANPDVRRSLLLAAHEDEIALMVKQIVAFPDEEGGNGFLRVSSVGGVDIRHLYGQTAVVHGRRDLVGVIGSLPSFMLPEERQDKAYGYDDLLVDVGLPAAELRQLVQVGDFISFRQPLRKLLNNRVTGKALDNRASVAAVTVCLEQLQGRQHQWDVVAVATAQEETALLGAFTSAHAQRPDAAIAIDVTFAKGPGASNDSTFELDEGPVIDLGPNVHPGMYKALMDAAEALEMKVNTSTHARFSGTDAYGLQIARQGIPTGLVSIPLRYMHTMVETVTTADVERVGRLLAEVVVRLDDKFLEKLAAGLMETGD